MTSSGNVSAKPSREATSRAVPQRTATAPLLYWLLVICGLTGITVQRADALEEVLPLWVGTIVGLALGQLIAWARVRVWVLAALGMTSLWLSPVFFIVFYNSLRGPAETSFYAFVPALICGYLALSERGGLLAFWYPAVLWMLVILDGSGGAAAFDTRAALPLVVGLAALFVAFLRARETRRVALWHTHGALRLATPLTREVLRASPLRAASQHAWTALAGAAALVLAAWVAPHLWQTEQGKHTTSPAASAGTTPASGDGGSAQHCCAQPVLVEAKRVRVREYFPLVHGHDEDQDLASMTTSPCTTVCQDGEPAWTTLTNDYDGFGAAGDDATFRSMGTSPPPYGYAYGGGYGAASPASTTGNFAQTAPSPASPPVFSPSVVPSADAITPPAYAPTAAAPTALTLKAIAPVSPSTPPSAQHPATTVAGRSDQLASVIDLTPAAAPPTIVNAPPWRSVLVLCGSVLGLHLLGRALRRKLTLRHLARPFWPETLDQRISNHWERMLIGLRDAGIHTASDEQPEALAKRVGIEGMDTCAAILERVRHGVRVDLDDLATMDAAAGAVYRQARREAGLAGRAASLVRWPLA
jgi:hypothetical protein